jgi:cell division protein FtsW
VNVNTDITVTGKARSKVVPTLSRGFDWWLLLSAGALLYIGLVMITSASTQVGEVKLGDPLYYFSRHAVFLVGGIAAGIAASMIKIDWWFKSGWLLLFTSLALLVLVLVIGREVNGSTRWIRLGPINVQPSEIAKLFLLGYLAGYLVRRREEVMDSWWGFVKPIVVMFVVATLLLIEPDFGATVVIVAAALGMIFLSGAKPAKFIALMAVCLALGVMLIIWKPYRLKRLWAYTDPWADQFNSGYQLTQSLIAFGRGEWTGLGLGQSVQKLMFLPEAHTDFVYAIIAEEFGLVGAGIVILLFSVLVSRGMCIAANAEKAGQLYAALFAYGISLLIGIQAFINIGVNTGLLPTKGLTLPLISYGGSSLIMSCIAVGVLYRIDRETRLQPVKPANGGRTGRRGQNGGSEQGGRRSGSELTVAIHG